MPMINLSKAELATVAWEPDEAPGCQVALFRGRILRLRHVGELRIHRKKVQQLFEVTCSVADRVVRKATIATETAAKKMAKTWAQLSDTDLLGRDS
jgi:hypothetical protein